MGGQRLWRAPAPPAPAAPPAPGAHAPGCITRPRAYHGTGPRPDPTGPAAWRARRAPYGPLRARVARLAAW